MAPQQDCERRDRAALLRHMLEEEGGISPELYAPHAVSHKPWSAAAARQKKGFEKTSGPVEERVGSFDLKKVFSNAEVIVEDALESGDKVAIRWRLRGTHTGAFAGVRATRRPVDVTGINIYRFVGDKIVESWGEVDAATMSAQSCQQALEVLGRPSEVVARPGLRATRR